MNSRLGLAVILAAALLGGAALSCRAEEEEQRQIVLPKDITTANLKFNNSGEDKSAAEDTPAPSSVYKSTASTAKTQYIFVNKDADKKTPSRWNTPNKAKKTVASKTPARKTVIRKLKISKSKFAAGSLDTSKSGGKKFEKPSESSNLGEQIIGEDKPK